MTRWTAELAVPCDEPGAVLRPGVVEARDGVVTHVGTNSSGEAATEVRVDGLLLPGLINTHSHAPMSLFRGVGANLPLERWLGEVIWPQEAHLTEEDVYWGMTLACAEQLRFGVTTSCEMYFFDDALCDAVLAAGARAVVASGVLPTAVAGGSDGASWWTAQLERGADLHRRRHGDQGRIEVAIGPHAPYTVPMAGLRDAAELARTLGALFHTHLAETSAEVAAYVAAHGVSEVVHGAEHGLFDGRALLAHGVWLDDHDVAMVAELGVAISHCPQSNAKLASGMAPVRELLDAGVTVGLGTDGPASNNDLDLWDDMRTAAFVARLRTGDATALGSTEALELATKGGGRALGRGDLGVVRVGGQADLIAVAIDDSVFTPVVDDAQLLEHLVWSGSGRSVTDVWVAGRQVVEDGRPLFVDVERARHEVQRRAVRLAEAVRR